MDGSGEGKLVGFMPATLTGHFGKVKAGDVYSGNDCSVKQVYRDT
jgi:hypothetical protein